jgi:predicted Zn-dependent protease
MNHAHVSPAATAAFFDRLRAQAGDRHADERKWEDWMTWAQSHPSPADRAEAFRKAERKGERYKPALTAQEFAAIRSMCREDKDVEGFDLF